MSKAQAEEFIEAAAAGTLWGDLAAILAKPPGLYARGSIKYWRDRLASKIEAAKKAKKANVTLVAPAAAQAELSKAILDQVREKAAPVLQRGGYNLKKNRESTAFLVDGAELTAEEVFVLANQTLKEEGLPLVSLET